MDPLDPALLGRDEVRAALAARDVGALYRLLKQSGVSQRRIAELTNQSPSEVSEILQGRQVRDVRVLERIATGIGVPRAWMGLSYGEEQPDTPSAEEGLDEEMKRRALIAATTMAALGQAVQGLGEFTELALPTGAPLPSRLGMAHVHAVGAVTTQLRSVARCYGGQADLFGAAAQLYTRWMEVPAPEATKAALATALTELHNQAGTWSYDSGLDGTGHLTRALRLAAEAGDAYGIANAAWRAGATLFHDGYPDDALKSFQLGQFQLGGFAPATVRVDDPRVLTLTAWLSHSCAGAYALLERPDQARRCLAEVHDGWAPPDAFERASADRSTAAIQLALGQLDSAEQFAASAVRTYSEGHRLGRIQAELLLAEVHVRAGEPQGLTLAHHAIDQANTLQSIAARRNRLVPLAAALEARPSTDTQELARIARQAAATRISRRARRMISSLGPNDEGCSPCSASVLALCESSTALAHPPRWPCTEQAAARP